MNIAIRPTTVMVPTANATSLSSASITGAVAAIAEPPQMVVPTAISEPSLSGTLNFLASRMHSVMATTITLTITLRDSAPVLTTWKKLSRAPRKTIPSGRSDFMQYFAPALTALGR